MKKYRQPAEPYRIKSVEPIKLPSPEHRREAIIAAKYNIFRLDATDIYIDLLTDSGTGAMSIGQWAALMLGDETYAGAKSFRKFEATVREVTGKQFIIPCHQGRSAENLMFTTLIEKGQYVPNNTHFDTTRGNTLHKGGIPIDLPCVESASPEPLKFKGNMDTMRLEEFIHKHGPDKIALVIMTVTNNSVGGQPVSMANIRATSNICKKHGLRFYFDCARFAENAYFIKRDEPGYEDRPIPEIVNEMFDLCDGAMMSAKKDGLSNIGGFVATDDEELYHKLTELMVLVEGFSTYGGLAGRDLDILSVGLIEVMDYDYLDFRVEQVAYFGKIMKQAGVPIIEPTGGHALFCDAGELLPHIPKTQFPGQAMTIALYLEGAVRAVELGSLMFGDTDPNTGKQFAAPRELVRMALPRRVYTNSQLDYVAEATEKMLAKRDQLVGFKITRQSVFLRHFTCELAQLTRKEVASNG